MAGTHGRGRQWTLTAMSVAGTMGVIAWQALIGEASLGVGAAILVAAGLALVVIRWWRLVLSAWGLALAASALLAVTALIWRPSLLALAVGLVAIVTLAVSARHGTPGSALAAVGRTLLAWPSMLMAPFVDWAAAARWLRRGRGLSRARPPRFRGLLAWLPGAAVATGFALLFSAANPLFAHGMRVVAEAILPDTWPTPFRWLTWIVVGLGTYFLLRAHLPTALLARLDALDPDQALLGADIGRAVRFLLLVNIVFAVQSIIDARYLWGGSELPAGVTYSDFARHGAAILIVAVLASAAITLLLFGPASAPSQSTGCRVLALAWLLQNAFLVVSAAERLNLYVQAYGLTLLRLAAAAWMLVVLLGVLITAWKVMLRKSHAWQFDANALVVAVVLVVACFVDARGTVAWFNVRHAPRTVDGQASPDLDYLASLGPAALPAIKALEAESPSSWMGFRAARLADHLQHELRAERLHWQAWSVHRERLARKWLPAHES